MAVQQAVLNIVWLSCRTRACVLREVGSEGRSLVMHHPCVVVWARTCGSLSLPCLPCLQHEWLAV